MELEKSRLHPVEHVVTAKVGSKGKLTTLTRKYWEAPEQNVSGLKKIGMSDNEIAIVNKLLENSNHVYVAGGAVRDLVMGKTPHDFDIATDLRPEQVMNIFGKENAKLTGNVFPTVRVKHGEAELEVSTFRSETSKAAGDRNAVNVKLEDNIEADTKRRDLTINALALNAKTGELVDAVGGLDDIKNKVIRFVGDPAQRLEEDPMRYLRAIRFKLRIDGEYAPSTREALSDPAMRDLFLQKVTPDRIHEEILKGVGGVEKFSGFFGDLKEFGMLESLFPEIHRLVDHDGGPHHGEPVYEHSMDAGDNYGKANPDDKRDILTKFSAYVHDIGKPDAYDPENKTFYEHEDIGAEMVPDFLKRFKFSNDEIKLVQSMVANHMRTPTTMKGVRKLYTEIGDNVDYLLKLGLADKVSNQRKTPEEIAHSVGLISEIADLVNRVKNEKDTFEKIDVNGHDLMKEFNLKPGPHLKDMLDYAKDQVLEDPTRNNKDQLVESIRKRFEL